MMYLDIITTTTDNDNTDVQSPRLFVMHARILSELSPYALCVCGACSVHKTTDEQTTTVACAWSLFFSDSLFLVPSLSFVHSRLRTHTPRTYTLSLPHTHTRADFLVCAAKQLRKSSYNDCKQRRIIICI